VRCPSRLAARTMLRVDSGAPQASNRAGSRAGGGGVKPPASKPAAKSNGSIAKATGAAAKTNGNGSRRSGPVDPRTEDSNSPPGLSRAGKTVWRRPGSLTPRTAKHRETGAVDAPIEFAVALPLAPAPTEPEPTELAPTEWTQVEAAPTQKVEAKNPDTVRDLVVDPAVVALAPTVEVLAPEVLAPSAPTELVPTILVPAELRTVPVPMPVPAPILYDEAATIDDVTKIGPILETRPLLRPIHFRRAPKPRIRRVTRVVRHVDTWSVFKVAVVFSVFFYAVAMVAGVLLWQVAYATGTIDNVEKFFEGFGWESFDFNGGQIFHNAWIAGLFVAVGLTGLAVLLATLFNLITDLVGGIRFSVLEEEVRTRAERGTEPVVSDTASVILAEGDIEAVDDPDAQLSPPAMAGEAIAG
jgi:Transmembrane domain of unknown function (DUF3566)